MSNTRSETAHRAVRSRRRKHPGGSRERLSSVQVHEAFRRRKTFSTLDVMTEFGAAKDNVTAVCAVLVGQRLLESAGLAPDDSSLWRWR